MPPEHLPVKREILAKPGGQKDDSRVFIEYLRPIHELLPRLEIITEEQEVPRKDRLPSFDDDPDPDESVWLTAKTVKDRLDVLLHTDPEFNTRPPIVGSRFHGVADDRMGAESMQSFNRRKGVDLQEVVNVFQRLGYQFALDAQNNVVMLVDATVPRGDNTAGRYQKVLLDVLRNRATETVVEGYTMISLDRGKTGVRPATSGSTNAIAVPIDMLLTLHQNSAGVDVMYFGRITPLNEFDRLESDKLSINDRQVLRGVRDVFREEISHDPILGARIQEILRASTHQEQRLQLFDLLTGLGLRSFLWNEGYFPYEVSFVFGLKKPEMEGVTLQELQYDDEIRQQQGKELAGYRVNHLDASRFMLEDILWLLEHYFKKESE